MQPYCMIPIVDLIPYLKNAKQHSVDQVGKIAASIKEFGFLAPIITDGENGILAGHGRVLAAQKLGMKHVPCVQAGHLTKTQRRAYVLADNKLTEAPFDLDMLKIELMDLSEEKFDLDLLGFDIGELEGFLSDHGGGLTNPEEVPPAPDVPITKHGDLWVLGGHRLLCGSSTVTTDVARVLRGAAPMLMVTDPPYGVEYDPAWRKRCGINKNDKKMGKVLNDDCADWRAAWGLFPGDVAYVWHASMFTHVVLESLESCGFKQRSMIIWAKDRFTLGRGDYHWQHEPCWYVVRNGKTGHYVGGRKQSTVWNISARDDGGLGHSTQKPIECMKRPIENNSNLGQAVYEPFAGSGTTIIAAEMTGRCCLAIELNPTYVDIAVKRWQNFTGKRAVLEEGGG